MIKFIEKSVTIVLIMILVIGMINMEYSYADKNTRENYSDIKGHWAEASITDAMNKGWVNNSSIFRPKDSITRAEFIKIINNAFGFNNKATISFKDVKSNQWFYEHVCIAVGSGYINGYEDNTLRPNNYITRQEAASIITSIKNNKDDNLDKLSTYLDANNVAPWAKSSVEGAIECGYMRGVEVNRFNPKTNITRAETIVTIKRVTEIKDEQVKIATKIPVLMYHHFDNTTNLGAVVAKEEFKKQIKYLKDNGYNTITIQELINFKEGKKDLPKKSVLITSDDGYLSNYEFMYPILKENNMKATIFVIGENIDNAEENIILGKAIPKFSWGQAKEMNESGVIDIQSHTYNSHIKTQTINGQKGVFSSPIKGESEEKYKSRINEDISKAIEGIEKNLGYKPIAVAYPFGEFSESSEQVLKENGIKVTFTVKPGIVDKKNQSTYLLNRVTVSGKDNMETFIEKLNQ